MICLCSKTTFCCDAESAKYKFCSNGLNKRTLEKNGDEPIEKYRRIIEEVINNTPTNREIGVLINRVGTYD